ncbi:uncharacterized protein LOC110620766 [Manihot esculenta]|uniref:Uncharacterized protein n=1 Tax=Manihot esculenta TaxID=3983 RepID=A0A2C9VE08_MANES|nr:uncharacterized protein LOC110620766 [Manihot esculenta]OAY42651.1 hypothetical protein MANES_08G004900v8 [Manihot esculenta]
MADLYSLCLLGVMDRLWFHQIILLSESSTVLVPKTLKQQTPFITESLIDLPSTSSFSSATSPEEEIPSSPISLELNNDKEKEEEQEQDKGVDNRKQRPTRLNNLATSRFRSHSSSPSTVKRGPKNIRNPCSSMKLQKSMSCRSLKELELEEVKGFMDLGFIFKKEHISPRMITVVPGLLRLGLLKNKHNTKVINSKAPEDYDKHKEREEQEDEKGIIRPYLSEAWLIKRPNSPLLNLTLPRVSEAADMKKHLKFWARTVASVLEQEA